MKVRGRILEWGNSVGIRLAKSEAFQAGLRPDVEVEVEVKQRIGKAGDFFGMLERKVDTAKVLKEIDDMFGE